MSEEVQKYEVTTNSQAVVGLSPLVQAAMSGVLDTQKLAELLAIQKAYEDNEARKAYYMALAEFKRHPLTIYKDKRVTFTSPKGGTTDYRHATLGAALDEINPLLGKCEMSLTWDVMQADNGAVAVTAILSHAMGHCEKTSLIAPPDDSGNKNRIQMVGSTIEYLKRYTAFALLGISSRDMDDDGRGYSSRKEAKTPENKVNIPNQEVKRFKCSTTNKIAPAYCGICPHKAMCPETGEIIEAEADSTKYILELDRLGSADEVIDWIEQNTAKIDTTMPAEDAGKIKSYANQILDVFSAGGGK